MEKFYKVRREIMRILSPLHWGRQLLFRLVHLYVRVFRSDDSTRFNLTGLETAPEKALVCFVSFAPSGFRPDTRVLLRQLSQSKALSIFVASNCSIPLDDQQFLTENGIIYEESENTGYDFGAYRRFCVSAIEAKLEFSRLILLNDSFVFPIDDTPSDVFFPTEGSDFIGLIEQGHQRKRARHFCSFYLNFSRNLATSDVFWNFWRKYRPLPMRFYTIRMGEKALSQTIFDAGFSSETMFGKRQLLEKLTTVSHAESFKILNLVEISNLFLFDEYEISKTMNLDEQRELISKVVNRSENLRMAALYSAYCGASFVKVRSLKEEEKLRGWYQDRYERIRDLNF